MAYFWLALIQKGKKAGAADWDWPDLLGKLGPDALFSVIVLFIVMKAMKSITERHEALTRDAIDALKDTATTNGEVSGAMRMIMEYIAENRKGRR